MKKILVINPFGIGDVLFSTPLLKNLKKKYPDSKITYICNKRACGVMRNNPNISNIYIFEKDEYRDMWKESKIKCLKAIIEMTKKLRNDKYDILIDMTLNYLFSLMVTLFVSVPVRVGFNYRKRGRFLTHKLDIEGFTTKHVIEYYLELGKMLGMEILDKNMDLFISENDRSWACDFFAKNRISRSDKICGIIPGCGASWGKDAIYRRWSTWKFAEVADHIAKEYAFKIMIFGESKEMPICVKVQNEMKTSSIQACGAANLEQFAALLDRCDLIVTNDGGPLHMAVALRRKTVAIFGPVDEKVYGPYPSSSRHIAVASKVSCRPCYNSFKYSKCTEFSCLKSIAPKDVIGAIERLLEKEIEV